MYRTFQHTSWDGGKSKKTTAVQGSTSAGGADRQPDTGIKGPFNPASTFFHPHGFNINYIGRLKHKYLNAEFQRIARRDKKAFFSNQCKEIEENNRMGKTRDLFKKIRDTKGKCHTKMDSIKDRNGMDLTEAKDIKKRWQEYTEELYKKDLHDPDNHDGVITDLEPDILEGEVGLRKHHYEQS